MSFSIDLLTHNLNIHRSLLEIIDVQIAKQDVGMKELLPTSRQP